MPYNQPPRDEILEVITWLRGEVYPGIVGHPLNDEGIAAWVCDVYIHARQTQGHEDAKHRVFEAIENRHGPSVEPPGARRLDPDAVLVLQDLMPPVQQLGVEEWLDRYLDLIHDAGDQRWGKHAQPDGTLAGDVITLPEPGPAGAHRLFDVIEASTDPAQARKGWLEHDVMRIGAQAVPWTRRATRLEISDRRFLRDGRPVFLVGMTSFDLSKRLLEGDARWVTDVLAPMRRSLPSDAALYARIVTATVYRGRLSYVDGINQLPPTLAALEEAGIYAEVVAGLDTADFPLELSEFRGYYDQIERICANAGNTLLEAFNENTHGSQQAYASDLDVLEDLAARTSNVVPFSAGSSHGGEDPLAVLAEADYLTHHADRGRTPEENAIEMARFSSSAGLPILDDEPIGIDEVARPGARVADPEWAERQARSARAQGLAGTLLHLEAGLECRVEQLGQVQHAAIDAFLKGLA